MIILKLLYNPFSLLIFELFLPYTSLMFNFILQLSQLLRMFSLPFFTLLIKFQVPLTPKFLCSVLGVTCTAQAIYLKTER